MIQLTGCDDQVVLVARDRIVLIEGVPRSPGMASGYTVVRLDDGTHLRVRERVVAIAAMLDAADSRRTDRR